MSGSTRWWTRLLLVVAALAVAGTVVILARDQSGDAGNDRNGQQVGDLGEILDTLAAGLSADARYRPPTLGERADFLAGLDALASGDSARAAERLRPLGYTVRTARDPDTGREFGLLTNDRSDERAWGLYLIDLSAPTSLAVEVPHPANDLHTPRIGLALYREVPGSLLSVSGTNRKAAGGAGDVAHEPNSMFHAVAAELAGRGLPQVQLHGFHDTSLPDADVVVSPGAGDAGAVVRRAASRLDSDGFSVCRSWERDCGRLEGTRNEQGIEAKRLGTVFLHIEISRTIRDDPARRIALARALASAGLTGT